MASENQILEGWLIVIARDGWRGGRIDAVAVAAGASAAEVAVVLPDRWTALRAYGRQLDLAALTEAGSDRDASIRDRLFALLMARFDAAEEHKAAARELADAARRDPGLAAFFLTTLPVSVARIAAAAGVDTGGWLGPLRVQLLTVLVAQVSRTWLDDEDTDLAATMKSLDAALARAERWAQRSTGSLAATGSADDLRAV